MKLKLLDRPSSPGPRQDAWDDAVKSLHELDRAAWQASLRKRRGSRKSRRLFRERVVKRAIERANQKRAAAIAKKEEVGEIVELSLSDWTEHTLYSTIEMNGERS